MLTAHRTDRIETGRHTTWMESVVRVVSGEVHGRTRIWTNRSTSVVVGAVRVIAVDVGGVVAFTGERRFCVGGRPLPTADRTVEWTSALFAHTLDEQARLEVVHFRPPRRNTVDRLVERL